MAEHHDGGSRQMGHLKLERGDRRSGDLIIVPVLRTTTRSPKPVS